MIRSFHPSLYALLTASALAVAAPALVAAATPPGAVGIIAVVDDQVVSSLDVTDRVALIMGTTGIADTPETRARLEPQILRALVDERLQMEEAERQGITISDAKIQEGIAELEKQSNKPPGSLDEFLASKGLSKASFHAQVKAQLAWSEVLSRKVRPKIRVSDQEVARYVKRREGSPASAQEVQIASILLPVDAPTADASVKKAADKLSSEIQGGVSFDAVASQFSSGTGSTRAAPPIWVEMSQLDPAIAAAVARAGHEGITPPVRTAAGYQIIRVMGVRASHEPVPEAAPRAELAFKRILMTLKPDAQPKEAQLLLTLASEVAESPGKCENKGMAGAGRLSDFDFKVSLLRADSTDLSDRLRTLLMSMKVGSVSEPIVSAEGISLFMLCERTNAPKPMIAAKDAVPKDKDTPSSQDAIRAAIFSEKLQLEAQKYMRNLRRDAFIEVRSAGN